MHREVVFHFAHAKSSQKNYWGIRCKLASSAALPNGTRYERITVVS